MIVGEAPIDPRLHGVEASEGDVRPIVDKPRAGAPTWVWISAAGIAGLLLFSVLNARRQTASAPAVVLPTADRLANASPPPLYVPAPIAADTYAYPLPRPADTPSPALPPLPGRYVPQPRYVQPAPSGDLYPPIPPSSSPRLVAEPLPTRPAYQAEPIGDPALARPQSGPNQVKATSITEPGMTVLQGTLIPAILETGFDSSRPGYARALVQRDIKGFDGSRILIPRGSRVIGEYSSEVSAGQKRAMIAWTRLIRPDGVSIAIDSPASDPVGRGGVRASVNDHFFQRFAGAILQSSLDIGVNLVSQSSRSPAIVAIPGSLQGATSFIAQPRQVMPTLAVRPGTSISVFVARDLNFSDVETRR